MEAFFSPENVRTQDSERTSNSREKFETTAIQLGAICRIVLTILPSMFSVRVITLKPQRKTDEGDFLLSFQIGLVSIQLRLFNLPVSNEEIFIFCKSVF